MDTISLPQMCAGVVALWVIMAAALVAARLRGELGDE